MIGLAVSDFLMLVDAIDVVTRLLLSLNVLCDVFLNVFAVFVNAVRVLGGNVASDVAEGDIFDVVAVIHIVILAVAVFG